jgi:uncharacterized membrane protein YtjA (UPF0391 family)
MKESVMLFYAAVFFVIAIIAENFGFGDIAVGVAEIARSLLFFFVVVFLVSLIMGTAKDRWRSRLSERPNGRGHKRHS